MNRLPSVDCRLSILASIILMAGPAAYGGDWPQTRAERTGYQETSHYDDVIQFLDGLKGADAPISVRYIGESASGKKLPLVIASRPLVANPAQTSKSGKPVIYIQANIHAGEVEGKEAILILLRELSQGDKLLDKVILLVTPIYNIDGNEKFGDGRRNRPSQDGPELIGERASGEGFDLNRDCIKAESLEMRAVLEYVYVAWNPSVIIDLHTTNGTRHGFTLTYSPPLNPNTESGILRYTRDELLPNVRARMLKEHGERLFDYGNAEGSGADRAWRTFGEEGRYVTNYAGLRNRIGILSEAASFQPFETRVESTRLFVRTILEEVARQSRKVTALTKSADSKVMGWRRDLKTAPEMGVRFEGASRGGEPVMLEKPQPNVRIDRRKAPVEFETVLMPVYDRFKATRIAKYPAAYVIPESEYAVVELLRRHGIVVKKLTSRYGGGHRGERFAITDAASAPAAFQGHRLVRFEGKFEAVDVDAPTGAYVVQMRQPLGILIFHMLEPESLDGVAAWGFLQEKISPGGYYPILKVRG